VQKAPKETDADIMSRNGALTDVLFALAYHVGMPDCITWTVREIYLISYTDEVDCFKKFMKSNLPSILLPLRPAKK
jgi:hypothetical protein